MVRSLAIVIAGIPVLMLAWSAWGRFYAIARQDHKERAALKLADSWPPFARAWATVQRMRPTLCGADSPWRRPESSDRHVYVVGGR